MTTPPEPGEPRRVLDRPPGERYAPARERATPSATEAALRFVAIVIGGALVVTVLGGILSMTLGLVVVAAFIGWLCGRLAGRRSVATVLAVGTVGLGLLGIWAWSRLEGGVLDPLDYLGQVQGPLAVVHPLVAGALAAAAAR